MSLRFALNHMVAPHRTLSEFFALTQSLGLRDVEIRNDIPTPLIDKTPAESVRDDAAAHGLSILSINALQRFNDWNALRASEAAELIAYAKGCGAKALVLCPINDVAFRPEPAARLEGLCRALAALAPMLRNANLTGLVEPLGFEESSLRSKREAVEAIDAAGGGDVFKLVHDTFHHHVAGEPALFPERTGLVHVSGVSEASVDKSAMRDPHRALIDRNDVLGNVGQVKALIEGGYRGPFSFEPFAESVARLPDARAELAASIAFIENEAEQKAA